MSTSFITLTSDFGVQSQGIGAMEAMIFGIAPETRVIHLMHGLPSFDVTAGARTMETVQFLPIGIHVCVVDPGVGTKRKGIIIKTKRGDYFVGPDNGVFVSATNILGGCENVVEISNSQYMRQPVSPIFHGRDVFASAAAHLSCGVPLEEFGAELSFENLIRAPYFEAVINHHALEAQVIHINKFGSLHLNILHAQWDQFGVKKHELVLLQLPKQKITIPFVETFGDVEPGQPLILKDDYGRVEVALNMGSFAERYGVKVGDRCGVLKI